MPVDGAKTTDLRWQLTARGSRIAATATRAPDGRMDMVLDGVRERVCP